MSAETGKEIWESPFPAFAAECRWNDEQRYGSSKGLRRRLDEMTKAGIVSEVLDVIEALEMDHEEAKPFVITAYEKQSRSATLLATLWKEEGKLNLAEDNEQTAKADKAHAIALKTGEKTIAEELQELKKWRKDRGIPTNNFYITLLHNPVFPKE